MRTAVAQASVERGGVQAESTFTIKATSKAFDILSSGLYSDKVRAIVRELSCNAYDSHVAAGKADTPIEVKLPSSLDQTFHVRDFGLGLSHEGVMQLYTTYFESTKTESDDFIGQLGLGSKSPFSYAPTFTVESRFEGVRRVYTCFKNEIGMPAISLMGEELTDECNGVTVALAVRRDDIDKFHDAAKKVFMYFDPAPTVVGYSYFEPYRIKHTIQGTNWKIRETDYAARMTGPYVVQGFVAYPLDAGILHERELSLAAEKLLKTNLDITVDIGKVEVAASREALSYDVRTIDNLVAIVERIAVEMYDAFQAEFDLCTTPWEVAQMYGKFAHGGNHEFRSIFEAMHKDAPFQWKGAPVFTRVLLNLSNVRTTKLGVNNLGYHNKVNTNGSWTPDTANKTVPYDVSDNSLIVVVDKEAKGHHNVVRSVLTGKHTSGKVLLIAPTSKKLYSQAEVDHIIKQLGNPPVVYADTLNVVRVSSTYATPKRTAEEKLVWQGFPEKTDYRGREVKSDKFSRKCWATETVVLEDGGFYVDLERFEAQYNGAPFAALDNLIVSAITLGFIDVDTKVYGIQKRDQKHIADNGEWVNLVDHIKEQFNAANTDGALFNRSAVENIKTDLSRGVINIFVNLDNYFALLNDGPFKTVITKVRDIFKNAPKVNADAVNKLAAILDVSNTSWKVSTDVNHEWRAAMDNYGMLKIINWSSLDFNTAPDVVDYINLVDKV